ncbi:30S ribosomal protein S20 [Porphyromonas crevioricanis]|uniref:Small ribosomal subunit protein bS20 n=1 Tax=Porphyromonas crevioricanis TaxID=393921 RepID=A0A0A2FXV7_9PORP|nr:30S ribosomal protein S20 [Porphyromonas crevioricanis]KGN91234.1 30S ribosomal protein S20 [Porphyromonas crevioricanis]KGN93064.1 30S ribosomal protein S20 [Porphyromonas crevioricanis]SJZ84328.1 small subunit ribosomal protein S20 [Porphyromonas crevioricanis]SQH73068.1 30S ribosomal protein S20 [Porphyromonas crevioricanis]GAD07083.1 SSU ribosomal protein S20p [Porphyromonas crevioricanis JCM 13913]
MANHKSSIKRIRQTKSRRLHNRYYARTTRNAVYAFRKLEDRAEAEKLLPSMSSMLDKLAKRNIIHKNKAANLKSKLARQIARMA